jgi:hypothetical protein
MMLLGALIKQVARSEGQFFERLVAHDPDLGSRISREAERQGMDGRRFVADTIHRFMAAEDGESWTTIVSNIQRSDDPGFAFIETVMRKRLSHQCGQH